eukprot:1309796-Pyramimonas_sp.AAC.1
MGAEPTRRTGGRSGTKEAREARGPKTEDAPVENTKHANAPATSGNGIQLSECRRRRVTDGATPVFDVR